MVDRRVFLHIDEFGPEGTVHLPHLMCLSDPLVVWSPVAPLFERPHTFLTPHDISRLVRHKRRPLRIISRPDWFDRDWRDRHPYAGARHWTWGFDDVFKSLAQDDAGAADLDKRVLITRSEEGFQRADEVMASEIGADVSQRLEHLYAAKELPPGILEKAERTRQQGGSVARQILRDVYNHADATRLALARTAATPSEHMGILQNIVPMEIEQNVSTLQPADRSLSEAEVKEALRIVLKLKPSMSTRHLERFLASDHRAELLELLYSAPANTPLGEHLAGIVRESIPPDVPFPRILIPESPVMKLATVGGLVFSLASFLLSGQFQWDFIAVAIGAADGPLRKYSIFPEAIPTRSPAKSIFWLKMGRGAPLIWRKQIHKIAQSIEETKP